MAEVIPILAGLNFLRIENMFTDFTIIVKKCKYFVHKVVLAASSEYFKALFTIPRSNDVRIKSVSSEGFQIVLDYMYSSKLPLATENIEDVLEAAHYLQVNHVVQRCCDHLENYIDTNNCVTVLRISEKYYLKKLREIAYTYICSHLSALIENVPLGKLSAEQVENILKCHFPVNCLEVDVLYFVFKWFFSGSETQVPMRLESVEKLLRHIRYDQIPHTKLAEVILSISTKSRSKVSNIPLGNALFEYITDMKFFGSDAPSPTFNTRGLEVALVKTSAFERTSLISGLDFQFLDDDDDEWNCLTKSSHYNTCKYGSAVMDNNLYLAGGCSMGSIRGCIQKYNPILNEWTQTISMQVKRCYFTLTPCGGKLYAVGGITDPPIRGEQTTNCCERLDLTTDLSEFIDPLPENRSQHAAAAVIINGVPKLYVSGGMYKEHIKNTMYCFDTSDKTWRKCSSMLIPRANHFMYGYGTNIYICGGYHADRRGTNVAPFDTIEVFNCLSNTWKVITNIPRPRISAGYAAHDNNIYVLGGTMDIPDNQDPAAVDYYDVKTMTWSLTAMTVKLDFPTSCNTLYIPISKYPTYKNLYLRDQ